MERVDVERILRGIREEIRRRHPEEALPAWEAPALAGPAATADEAALEEPGPPLVHSPNLRYLNEHWQVDARFPIASHRALVGPLIVAWKRTLRKVVGGLFVPLFDRVTAFFSNVTNVLNALAKELDETRYRSVRNEQRLAHRIRVLDDARVRRERELLDHLERVEQVLVERMDLLHQRLEREQLALERRLEELEADPAAPTGEEAPRRGSHDGA